MISCLAYGLIIYNKGNEMGDRATRHRRNVGDATKIEYLKEQGNICPYCGMDILLKHKHGRKRLSLDHVIPYSVFKWTEKLLDDKDIENLYELVHSRHNYIICHSECNENKNSIILQQEDIKMLYLGKSQKKDILRHLHECKKYTELYNNVRDKVLLKQNYCCSRCLCKLDESNTSLRRYDENKPRVLGNAVALCKECSSFVSRYSKTGTLILRR